MLLVFSKASNGQDKEDPLSQFNESNELFNYITQICKKRIIKKKKKVLLFKTRSTYIVPRETHIPINPNDEHNKPHHPKLIAQREIYIYIYIYI